MPIIQSVERALKILDLFDEHKSELKITEISEMMGLHKSTVHSLLKTLQVHSYIDQNPEDGKYRLGLKLAERGNLVINNMDIRRTARKYLLDLSAKTGQTVHLGILDGREGVYIDKVEGEQSIIRYSRIGRRLPLHSTAIGKVLLAYQPLNEIELLLKDYEFQYQTNSTIMNEDIFRKEIGKVKQQGFAVDDQENEQGVRCAAVPIFNGKGHVLAAISISTLISRVNDEEMNNFVHLLKTSCNELSEQMRYVNE
ncbi:DNA-binding IclR family transcriptional regulator [Bacillus niacini]|uniref:Glycerol operon regulatory protein n=1 Tax=Neobacillus niacini TaxID=86668 RepID=A0A852TMG3_9BACI|nr:IclR family transcriptional regulator [Neobacillus niacini]NYE09415.1 DNA-binding IclR family transcriptional regulator [Neobacillus niacini]